MESIKDIENILKILNMLSEYYRAVSEQAKIKDSLFENLRALYKQNPSIFSEKDIAEINNLKNTFSSIKPSMRYNREDNDTIRNGSIVFHKNKYYVGVIDDRTKSKDVFEDSSSVEEYRVRVRDNKVLIAAGKNLKVIGTSRKDRCFACKTQVHAIYSEVCPKCQWFICSKCGSCGCVYSEFKMREINHKDENILEQEAPF